MNRGFSPCGSLNGHSFTTCEKVFQEIVPCQGTSKNSRRKGRHARGTPAVPDLAGSGGEAPSLLPQAVPGVAATPSVGVFAAKMGALLQPAPQNTKGDKGRRRYTNRGRSISRVTRNQFRSRPNG